MKTIQESFFRKVKKKLSKSLRSVKKPQTFVYGKRKISYEKKNCGVICLTG